jgi:hypothetical protein
MDNLNELTEEERYLFEVIKSSRKIQDFLWGELNDQWGLEEWKRMFRKREKKIDDININNPHAIIELKKRLLQNASLCIALLKLLNNPIMMAKLKNYNYDIIPSNLPEYENKNI